MPERASSSMSEVEKAAYQWVEREHAGLSEREQEELEAWLSADMRRFEKFDEYKRNWERFEEMGNELVLEEPLPEVERFVGRKENVVPMRVILPWVAVAAAVVVAFVVWWRPAGTVEATVAAAPISFPALLEQRTLEDGTVVELNRNASVVAVYSEKERRVKLERGEANFSVARNPERPFIVEVGGIEVRAVGTAFNVKFDAREVEVVVTEGKVRVDQRTAGPAENAIKSSFLEIGQKVTVALSSVEVPEVVTLEPAQIEQELLWQPKVLDFDNAALADIVAEFNRRNPVRLVLEQDALRTRRMSATFRSDNIEGFVRLLETHFAVKAEHRGDGEIALAVK